MQWQVCGTSFQKTLVQNAINEAGYYHIKISNVTDEQISQIKNNRDIKDVYSIYRVGDAYLEKSQNESKPYMQLFSMENDIFNALQFKLIDGRFPINNNEVIISQTIITNAKVNYKIGDTITIDVGKRKSLDDYDLSSKNPYNKNEEKLVNTNIYSFKIVGIIKRPSSSFEEYYCPSHTIITTGLNEGINTAFLSLKEPREYKTSIPELLGLNNYSEVISRGGNPKYDYTINTELLRWEAFAFSDSTVNMLYAVIGVVIAIIIITSVFCIRNSFAISTTEKIKMYSMLSSIGATKKQIKRSVIIEGLILGLIGIPIGIICGYFAVFVLLKIVNLLLGGYILEHVEELIFSISIMPAILSIVLGFITIYLSSISSARRASKVTPIDGLKNLNEIKLKSKKLKVPKIISSIFKTGGVLAYKNLKRCKKKYRTTVISIAISIFVFISMNSFIANAFDLSGDYYTVYGYDMVLNNNLDNLSKEAINKIMSLENVQKASILYSAKGSLKIKNLDMINKLPEEKLMEEGEYDKEKGEFKGNGEQYLSMSIMGLNSKDFREYVEKLGLKYENVKNKGVLCDNWVYQEVNSNDAKKIRRYNYNENDIINAEYNKEKVNIPIGKITDVKPKGLEKSYYHGGYIVLNIDEYTDIEFYISNITIQSDNTERLEKQIKAIDSTIGVTNLEELERQNKAMLLVIEIFLYGFIAVITLIGVTNIFNTITSNMELRQKEFAMLKSIGMTKQEFNRMINFETIFYSFKALLYGIILGLLGTLAMYKAFAIKIDKGMYIPINAILISIVFVFVFVFIIMKYSISKINKQNTIETIRNENI